MFSGALHEPKREPGEIPGRARRCNRDERCFYVTDARHREGAASRMNRESEDLPEKLQPIPVDTGYEQKRRGQKGNPRIIFMVRGFFLPDTTNKGDEMKRMEKSLPS